MIETKKRERFRFTRRRVLLLCIGTLLAYCKARPFPSRLERTTVQTASLIAYSELACKSRPFSVHGLRREVFERGHAHMPFGVWGEDRYDFWGFIQLGSRNKYIHLVKQYPLALASHSSGTFLLTRMWSRRHWWSHYSWYRMEHTGWTTLSMMELPFSCAQLRFTDSVTNYGYSIWHLTAMLDESTPQACEQLERSAKVQPRFAYYSRTSSDPTRSLIHDFRNFVDRTLSLAVSQCGSARTYDAFEKVLYASRASDDYDLGNVLSALHKIDPQRSRTTVTKFIESLAAQQERDGPRLRAVAAFHLCPMMHGSSGEPTTPEDQAAAATQLETMRKFLQLSSVDMLCI